MFNKVEYMKAWRRTHIYLRRLRVNSIAMERGCMDCGYNKHPHALDWDHVRGVKLFNIAHGLDRTWDTVQAELDKCEVVCANCHRIRTNRQREMAMSGTEKTY